MSVTADRRGTRLLLTGATYCVLFLVGAVQGVIGSFQYSRMPGSVPLASLVFCAAILATCLLGAWAMRSVSGALAPAAGWILACLVLSIPVSNGSVIISDSAAGKWYLYGGTISALAGVALSFGGWIRAQPR
jgi:Family of unknown function (DUF6113)